MRLPPLVLLLLLPMLAQAHGLHDHGGGLLAGLAHPLLGLDHLLAALAVGLWAGAAAGPARLGLPLAFTLILLFAAAFGHGGTSSLAPWIEPGIASSLLALGLMLVMRVTPHPVLAAPLLVLLAVTHGLAHGTEGPSADLTAYLTGLGATTLGLHLVGLTLARLLPEGITRLAGAGVLGSGLWALF
ncbi:MAG: HupE/UreJ family protein [Halothiobacillaceae bacterium]